MKLYVRGNTALIKSAIPVATFAKVKDFDVCTVLDENGNEVYTIDKSDFGGSINTFSFKANSVYQDNLALSITFEDMSAEEFVEAIKPSLVALKKYEEVILSQIAELADMLATVDEDIVME